MSSQSPSAGSVVDAGTSVSYSYYSYVAPPEPQKVTVPNLAGQSRSSAQSMIASAGLVYSGESSTSSGATSGNNGTVSSQSPSAGSLVNPGTSVSYSYYSYVAPPAPTTGIVYVTYIFLGSVYNESYVVDANNVVVQNISQAVSAYTSLLSGIGATSIAASISGPPTPAVYIPPVVINTDPPVVVNTDPPVVVNTDPPVVDTIDTIDTINTDLGGGCHVFGTKIQMSDGTFKNIENLYIGDEVMAANIPGLGDNEADISNLSLWSSEDISETTKTTANVTNIIVRSYGEYYLINNSIRITYEHVIPVKKNGIWKFITVEELQIGDIIVDENLQYVLVDSKELVKENVDTVSINTEPKDVYFTEGLMAHNIAWEIK